LSNLLEPKAQTVKRINAYLADAQNVFIDSRTVPLDAVSEMGIGNKPIDDGNYLFSDEEKEAFVKLESQSAAYFKRWYGSDEFINNKVRWCLWLGDCPPDKLRKMPYSLQRIENVRTFRQMSKSEGTRKIADTPTRFHVENMPESGHYLLVPSTLSERRKYIPIGFMNSSDISSNANLLVPNATLYEFGVLTSQMHMAWMRTVCGRLKSDYRYSAQIVYNNFPWPDVSEAQKAAIIQKRKRYWTRARSFPIVPLPTYTIPILCRRYSPKRTLPLIPLWISCIVKRPSPMMPPVWLCCSSCMGRRRRD